MDTKIIFNLLVLVGLGFYSSSLLGQELSGKNFFIGPTEASSLIKVQEKAKELKQAIDEADPYYYYKLGFNLDSSQRGIFKIEKVYLKIVPGLASVGLKDGVTPEMAQIEAQGTEKTPWYGAPSAWVAKTTGPKALDVTKAQARPDLFDWVLPVFAKDQDAVQSIQVPWIEVFSSIDLDDAFFEKHGLKLLNHPRPQTTCGSPIRGTYYAKLATGPVTSERLFKAAQELYADCQGGCLPNPGLGFPY